MPDLLLELFSEEIPARMQSAAAEQLQCNLVKRIDESRITHGDIETFVTPRRLAIRITNLPDKQPDISEERRGPKVGAPEQAIQGFLKSTGMTIDQLEKRKKGKDEFYFATTEQKGQQTASVLKAVIEDMLADFHWPKSMRWGNHAISWVRPLQNILCIFGNEIVPVKFGHLTANNYTFGHRFMAQDKIEVSNAAQYESLLEKAYVIADAKKRQKAIESNAEECARKAGAQLLRDPALLDEVTGLVEWPVVLLGKIDEKFMDLPHEVLISEMRNHQKYFNTYHAASKTPDAPAPLAPYFIITSNLEASDGGKAIISGNERVLRARLEDARFFWDSDRKKPLEQWAEDLSGVVFHAKLGTIAEKVERITNLSVMLADKYISGADKDKLRCAAQLCKADLTTGMVGEFPELQGIMGEYYASEQGEANEVAVAIREHYLPQGAGDNIPQSTIGTIISLADKLDTICGMFAIGEKPTGSKDPFALRRAALGIIRIIQEKGLRIELKRILALALGEHSKEGHADIDDKIEKFLGETFEILSFFIDRLKVQLKEKNIRPDIIDAVFANDDDDLVRISARACAVQKFIESEDGANLLAAHNRASNIVEKEESKDAATYVGEVDIHLLHAKEEHELFNALSAVTPVFQEYVAAEKFEQAMAELATLRPPVDAFFDNVMVNDKDARLRENRLKLLAKLRDTMDSVADFSRIQQQKDDKRKAA